MLTTTIAGALPHLKQGKLRVLAVTGARRSPLLADVPTLQEAGVASFDVNNYWGVVAPANTPREALVRLHGEVQKLLAGADFVERLAREGVEPMPGTAEAFGRFLRDDYAAWRGLVVAAKLTFDN
jgi:tripartite-type tricarboxylate transporter receptor subunit TctC